MALSANTEAFGGSNAYVAIGFRPLSLSNNSSFIAAGTGIPQEFGMRGADIVLGGAEGGIKTFYAAEYTGPPIADNNNSLDIYNATVEFNVKSGRTTLTFMRPLVSGYLVANNYGWIS